MRHSRAEGTRQTELGWGLSGISPLHSHSSRPALPAGESWAPLLHSLSLTAYLRSEGKRHLFHIVSRDTKACKVELKLGLLGQVIKPPEPQSSDLQNGAQWGQGLAGSAPRSVWPGFLHRQEKHSENACGANEWMRNACSSLCGGLLSPALPMADSLLSIRWRGPAK